MNWNVALDTGGVLVSDNVKIQIEIEALRCPTAASLENVMLAFHSNDTAARQDSN